MKGLFFERENVRESKPQCWWKTIRTYKKTWFSVPGSKFVELIGGKETLTRKFFVDANGKYFETILEFLRDRTKYVTDLPLDLEILKGLKR